MSLRVSFWRAFVWLLAAATAADAATASAAAPAPLFVSVYLGKVTRRVSFHSVAFSALPPSPPPLTHSHGHTHTHTHLNLMPIWLEMIAVSTLTLIDSDSH